MITEYFSEFNGFNWDGGNVEKNRIKHNVESFEAEQVFFNDPLIIIDDEKHSGEELRFAAFGKTNDGRRLSIVFTKRERLIRIISARDMNRKEKGFYETYEET
jgi:uncharacterized protein